MNTLSYRTASTKKEEVQHKWYVVDAAGQTAGRLFSRIAHVLRGKHTPAFTPHVDCGDCVIVINAEQIRFTGKKLDQKEYIRYTGYPGGQRREIQRRVEGFFGKNQAITGLRTYAHAGCHPDHCGGHSRRENNDQHSFQTSS